MTPCSGALLALALAAQPQLKLAVPGLTGVGVDEKTASFFAEHLAQQLAYEGAKVSTPRQIEAMVGFDRQKQLLGCSGGSDSCASEIGNALGVDGLVIGDVAHLAGGRFQVNVKLLSAVTGDVVGLDARGADTEQEVLEVLRASAHALSAQAAKALARSLSPIARSSEGFQKWWWAPAAVGAAGAALGAAAYFQADGRYQQLSSSPNLTPILAAQLRNEGIEWRLLTQIGAGVAAAGALGAGAVWLFGAPPPAQVALVPTGGGAAFVFSGRLP